jgi:DNA/RNA endonuclease YhcR with UshA esterase domain
MKVVNLIFKIVFSLLALAGVVGMFLFSETIHQFIGTFIMVVISGAAVVSLEVFGKEDLD